jgi:uncharacterized membrane protein
VSTNATTSDRLEFIDAQRGLAVVLMLWMHTADGWLLPALKQGATWNALRSVGGLAAPTFLLLAGLSLGMGWGASARPYDAARRRAAIARGLQIIVLGYALRMQMWMLDAGGVRHLHTWSAALPLGIGLWAIYRGLSRWGRGEPGSSRLGAIGASCLALGALAVSLLIPGRLWHLLRVDVLQAIGASLVCVALAGAALQRRPAIGLAAGAAIALLTPWLRMLVPGPLPHAIAGYVAQWDPGPGMPQPTLFPLFPWMAYAWIGASVGIHLGRRQRERGDASRAAIALTGAGALLALLTCEPLPLGHALVSHWPLLTQPVRVAYRVGVALVLGGVAIGLGRARAPFHDGLLALGRASLFVYWVHLEFAFGILSKPIARALTLPAWAAGWLVLVAAMSALAACWIRIRGRVFRLATRGPNLEKTGTAAAIWTRARARHTAESRAPASISSAAGQTPD